MSDQAYVVENDDVVEERSNTTPWWVWILLLLLVALIVGGIFLFREVRAGMVPSDTDSNVEDTSGDGTSDDGFVSWKDSVTYQEGGSGPPDPASSLTTDLTAVDHQLRLITANENLDPEACFSDLSEEDWEDIVNWSNVWGSDSPTRIEWQSQESRCSFVFPGNITDPIAKEDYEELLQIFSDAGYVETWFVGGDPGGEFGRVTYDEIYEVDSSFNRLHVYGPKLQEMPVVDN
jgi:hypothetical protein